MKGNDAPGLVLSVSLFAVENGTLGVCGQMFFPPFFQLCPIILGMVAGNMNGLSSVIFLGRSCGGDDLVTDFPGEGSFPPQLVQYYALSHMHSDAAPLASLLCQFHFPSGTFHLCTKHY